MKVKTAFEKKRLRRNVSRFMVVIGIMMMFFALVMVALRSFTIDNFNSAKHKSFLAPAGDMMEQDENNFSFAAVSDTGARNEPIEFIMNEIRKSDAKFVLYLGDLVRFRNPSHFKWMAEEIDEKLGHVPLYMVPGNHEITSIDGKFSHKLYNELFGQSYYWFSYGEVLFIGLDTSTESIDEAQLKWLNNVLTRIRPDYKYCIIYTHVPPFNLINNHTHRLDDESVKKFEEVLRGKDINLLMFGHVHYYSEDEFAGIPMITLPSSGQPIRSTVRKFGYVKVKVSPQGVDNVKVEYIDTGDDVEYLESFMSNALVKNEINEVSLWFFGFGLIILILGKYIRKKN